FRRFSSRLFRKSTLGLNFPSNRSLDHGVNSFLLLLFLTQLSSIIRLFFFQLTQLFSMRRAIFSNDRFFSFLLFQQFMLHLTLLFQSRNFPFCFLPCLFYFRTLYFLGIIKLLLLLLPFKILIEILRRKNQHQFIVPVFMPKSKKNHLL